MPISTMGKWCWNTGEIADFRVSYVQTHPRCRRSSCRSSSSLAPHFCVISYVLHHLPANVLDVWRQIPASHGDDVPIFHVIEGFPRIIHSIRCSMTINHPASGDPPFYQTQHVWPSVSTILLIFSDNLHAFNSRCSASGTHLKLRHSFCASKTGASVETWALTKSSEENLDDEQLELWKHWDFATFATKIMRKRDEHFGFFHNRQMVKQKNPPTFTAEFIETVSFDQEKNTKTSPVKTLSAYFGKKKKQRVSSMFPFLNRTMTDPPFRKTSTTTRPVGKCSKVQSSRVALYRDSGTSGRGISRVHLVNSWGERVRCGGSKKWWERSVEVNHSK